LKTASVQLANGEVFDSILVLAIDERRDLAVIKIAGVDLPALELGDSNALTVGEPVVVVGSPRGLEGTVTAGILSSVRDSDGFKLLQTDAAVNSGNSGGPIVNAQGQAIGVVSFKLRSAEGLNFAIPINYVRGLLDSLREPVTLDQMRQGLSPTSTPIKQTGGPSLKETLDWLKENIPLASTEFVRSLALPSGEIVTQSVRIVSKVWSFDSCTVTFGDVSISKDGRYQNAISTRYTLPLGSISRAFVERRKTEEHGGKLVSGQVWQSWLFLSSKSNEISVSISTSKENFSASMGVLHLAFTNESTAQRVRTAFEHAAELCRKSEPF
jgi:hypothetical protein